MSSEDNRQASLLTNSHRRYLCGGNEDLQAQSERAIRARIRNRIRNGVLDFTLLIDELEERDRERVFDPTFYPVSDHDESLYHDFRTNFVRNYAGDSSEEKKNDGECFIHQHSGVEANSLQYLDVVEGLHNAIGFLYQASNDAEIPFEHFLETAIKRSFDDPTRYEVGVQIAVKGRPPRPDVETAMRTIQNDERLTDAEFRVLCEADEERIKTEDVIAYSKEKKTDATESPELTVDDLSGSLTDESERKNDTEE